MRKRTSARAHFTSVHVRCGREGLNRGGVQGGGWGWEGDSPDRARVGAGEHAKESLKGGPEVTMCDARREGGVGVGWSKDVVRS
jgi:hypothetical protein